MGWTVGWLGECCFMSHCSYTKAVSHLCVLLMFKCMQILKMLWTRVECITVCLPAFHMSKEMVKFIDTKNPYL